MGAGKGRWAAALLLAAGLVQGPAHAQPAAFEGVALRDQQAQPLQPAWLRGRLLLLNFVYTGCSSTCPLQVRELAELHRQLPAEVKGRLHMLSVSVDPANDTPATLAAFARRMDADLPGWRFATGDEAQVGRLIERMQVLDTRKGQPRPEDHRTSIYLFDAGGQLLQRYRGVPLDRARLADEITRFSKFAGTTK
jgi:protein SCO1/2